MLRKNYSEATLKVMTCLLAQDQAFQISLIEVHFSDSLPNKQAEFEGLKQCILWSTEQN